MARGDLQFLDAQEDDPDSTSESETSTEDEGDTIFDSGSSDVESVRPQNEEERKHENYSGPGTPAPQPGRKLTIRLGVDDSKLRCHVCGKLGHCAGFVGAKYVDCPNKPCYLCGEGGHSTMTCPYRTDPGHDCGRGQALGDDDSEPTPVSVFRRACGARRQHNSAAAELAASERGRRWHLDAAVYRLHDKRVTCLEFHPTNDALVLSGSKGGRIAVWDMERVHERTVYREINWWQTMGLRFLPNGNGDTCASCSHDGTVKVFDVETGFPTTLFKANDRGWRDDDGTPWIYFMCLDVLSDGRIVAGDSQGQVIFCDPRVEGVTARVQAHKKATRVQSASANPLEGSLLLTAGNDHAARLFDLRRLGGGSGGTPQPGAELELAVMMHPKVINAAYFSPLTGRKVLTTGQDNRIRVWDSLLAVDQPPSRTIVHSQNFNRYLTPFRAEWDPKDPTERRIVCGRYISEDFDGAALHPVDILDAESGRLVAELVDPNITTISPVNKVHPRLDCIVSGSSRSLFVWRPHCHDDGDEPGPLGRADRAALGALRGAPGFLSVDAGDAGDDDDTGKKKRQRTRANVTEGSATIAARKQTRAKATTAPQRCTAADVTTGTTRASTKRGADTRHALSANSDSDDTDDFASES